MKMKLKYAKTFIKKLTKTNRKQLQNKLLGITTIVLGIFSAELTGDGTAMIMLIFIGTAAIIS